MLKKIVETLLFCKANDVPGDQRFLDLCDFSKLSIMVRYTSIKPLAK